MEEDEAITRYFRAGLQNNDILLYLERENNVRMSMPTLKRKLRRLNLYRRKNFSTVEEVITFIESELDTSNGSHGYKWWHKRLFLNGIITKRETVRRILKIIDPDGVSQRTRRRLRRRIYHSKGPNYIWHIDGYDKIKPYGIAIHSGIDGYSRYLLWLKADSTNNDAKVVAGYFWEAVESLQGSPLTVRSDPGTENAVIKLLQTGLRTIYRPESNRPPYLYGKSTANQKIESWWLQLRNHLTQFYINLFSKLQNDGHFEGSVIDKSLIRFCFLPLIQKELNEVRLHWNTHNIRKQRNSNLPAGKPCNMFFMPDRYNGEDQLVHVTDFQDIVDGREFCRYKVYPCDMEIYDIIMEIMREKNLQMPNDLDAYSRLNLYVTLRQEIAQIISE